jgi:hypothetical protein
MANDNPPKKNKVSDMDREKSKAPPKASSDRPFDMWLQKQLHAMYDEITAEPLPNDLLNLIDKDAGESKK